MAERRPQLILAGGVALIALAVLSLVAVAGGPDPLGDAFLPLWAVAMIVALAPSSRAGGLEQTAARIALFAAAVVLVASLADALV